MYQHPTNSQGEIIAVKSYVFHAALEQEEDGRWSAWIEALPGCATWGYSRDEALEALKDAAQAYLEVLHEKGQEIPADHALQTVDAPVVAVTL
jgi:predicted RNase H-like HicB family nuclease